MKFDPPIHGGLYCKRYIHCKVYWAAIKGVPVCPPLSHFYRHALQHHGRTHIDRPIGRLYECRPGGLRTGSPPSPPPALDPPHSAASPAVPALIGSGSPSSVT